jgi:hypothetical protein
VSAEKASWSESLSRAAAGSGRALARRTATACSEPKPGSGQRLVCFGRASWVRFLRDTPYAPESCPPARVTAFIRKADEGTIGKLVIEAVILLSARSQSDGGKVLRAAAQAYGVDTDAVALKVKQEFAAKEKARKATKPEPKPTAKAKRAA